MSRVLSSSFAFQRGQTATRNVERQTSHGAFTCHRVMVSELSSRWVAELRDRLDELTSLPVGWDGYLGRPVSFQCAHFVANMLERLCVPDVPAPSLVPGSDGSLQVEWHRNNFDVELDVIGAQDVVATRIDRRTNVEEVVEIGNDFSEIVAWISDLSDGANAKPAAADLQPN